MPSKKASSSDSNSKTQQAEFGKTGVRLGACRRRARRRRWRVAQAHHHLELAPPVPPRRAPTRLYAERGRHHRARQLHHTNSFAIGDWAVRRPGASPPEGRIVTLMVARHFDFLQALVEAGKLRPPLRNAADLRRAVALVDVLIGSAPVGLSTAECLLETAGKLPIVRFGSTETTLQVLGAAPDREEEARLAAFRDRWVVPTAVPPRWGTTSAAPPPPPKTHTHT